MFELHFIDLIKAFAYTFHAKNRILRNRIELKCGGGRIVYQTINLCYDSNKEKKKKIVNL